MSTRIVSLTEIGSRLGEHLAQSLECEHWFKPQPFGEQMREWYRAGHRIVFICATGIVVRTLASVLDSKHSDPPVLVLDERGRFVIPLVSGHEGGANEWAREVAELLDAQCVITTAQSYTRPVYVAGVGCERDCPSDDILDLIDSTLRENPVISGREEIAMAASVDVKVDEKGLLEWADNLEEPARFYPATKLLEYTERLSEKSQHVFDAVGCWGVAEAAALAGAEALSGGDAELLITKHKSSRATFALARAYLPEK
ncbi:MAG: cobalamin biosynthesis protein [Pseudomonadota bacterium]